MGYLPGDMDEKMVPALASYMDNLDTLLRGKTGQDEEMSQIRMQITDMFDEGILEVCALSLIRGRSLKNCMLICDEAQNATKTLIRDVISRAGEGVKVVVAGDPTQIDVPSLDSRNNGLTFAMESMKGSPSTAVICFNEKQAVRSFLSKEAIIRMKA